MSRIEAINMDRNYKSLFNKYDRFLYMFMLLLIAIPAILGILYINRFGVNVLNWDQWEIVPLIEKVFDNNITIYDIFPQHNEHRLIFPKIIMLALAYASHYNTIYEMYGSWFISLSNLILLFVFYKESFGVSSRSLLGFIPIPLLIFNFRQYENILWGFQIQIYLCILGFLVSIYMLKKSNSVSNLHYIFSILGGILSSFSFANGLLVWPIGLLFSFILNKNLSIKIVWTGIASIVFFIYFYGWNRPSYQFSELFIVEQPVRSATFFVANVGSPLSIQTILAVFIGIFLLTAMVFEFIIILRNKLLKENSIWLSFILFSLASSLIITMGRAGFGVDFALTSRYVTITTLGVIGIYFLSLSIYNNKTIKIPHASFLFGMIVLIFLLGILVGYVNGIHQGVAIEEQRLELTHILKTYNMQTNDNLIRLYPNVELVRQRADILRKYKLNVFSEEK